MSSSGEAWRIVQPAPRTAALALAGARARVRRLMLAQVRTAESAAVYRAGQPIALVMFARHGWRRLEMALAVAPEAAPHMKRLVRMAQLTLSRLAQDRLVIAAVDPANRAGQRMAMLTGFRPARLKGRFLWVYRSDENEPVRRRRQQQRGAQGSGGKPAGAARGERPPAGGAARAE